MSQSKTEDKRIILFYGNSITAGYELDMDDAFPAVIQRKIDSLNLPYTCINAGLSGETTASGLARLSWVLRTMPDVFVLELGANDALRGLDLTATRQNIQTMINEVKAINPNVQILIAGMRVPPNLGQDYTTGFYKIFPDLAEQNGAILIPFILEQVAAKPELNLPDGIHPTAAGHQLVAATVWQYLHPILTQHGAN